MSKKPTYAYVTETGDSTYAVKIKVSEHEMVGDEPEDFGGGNLGPAPYDLLLAALGECTVMTVRWYAVQKGWPVEHIEVDMSHHKEDRKDIFRKEVTITAPELTEEQHAKLREITAKCPIQRTLLSDITEIETICESPDCD